MSARIAKLLTDYHRRRALGESPAAEEYRERAGDSFDEFVAVLREEKEIDLRREESLTARPLPRRFGPYTLLRELGRGAVGVVYDAIHRELGRIVAVKVLRTGFDTQPVAVERFRREARACAQLRHDHIVQIHEAGEAEGRPYYAMSKLEGVPLSRLAREEKLPPHRELCAALAGITDALHFLHEECGIVHRDIKPSNIMVEPGGRMVLADFGLARTLDADALTTTGEALGTPLYMSPEQLLGQREAIDGRTDVYGMGATLYEVLAGRPLFQPDDTRQLMRMILTTRPATLHEVAPGVSRDLSDIVMKAVEKRSRDRYESAATLRRDLLAFARGEPIAGRPVAPWRRLLTRARLPAAAALALAVGIALLWPVRPAILSVASLPKARVLLDGHDVGLTPVTRKLEPGTHRVALVHPGFRTKTLRLELEAGQERSLSLSLAVAEPTDREALTVLAASMGLPLEEPSKTRLARVRSMGEGGFAWALFPRGKVTASEIADLEIELGPAFEGEGRLVFRRGGDDLLERGFDPPNNRTVAPLPEAVRGRLEVGDTVTWGVVAGDREALATFTIVEETLGERLEQVESCCRGQPPLVAAQLRAQVLLDAGRYHAAFKAATAIREGRVARAIERRALLELNLQRSPLWNDDAE